MHAKLGQTSLKEAETFFYIELPSAANDRAAPHPAVPPSAYGAARRPNWPAILLIALFHAALFAALTHFDVITTKKKDPPLVVIDIAEVAPPPADKPPAPKPEQKQVPVVTQMVAPPPVVRTSIVTPPPLIVAPPPPERPAAPVAAQAPGPVAIGRLDEQRIEGDPPRYPMESRRRKEQGTVVLRVLIGTDGRIAQISLAESSGFDRLDQAALQAVKRWRWQPWIHDGLPAEVRGLITFPFILQS